MGESIEIRGSTLVFTVMGELDDHVAVRSRDRIDNLLVTKGIKNIVFDLSELCMMDSAGIGLIIGRYRIIKENGGDVVLVIGDSPAKKVLKMSGLLKIFKAYDTLDSALTAVEKRVYG